MSWSEKRKKFILCVCAAFAFMIICHGFLLMNPSYNHDSLTEVIRARGQFQTIIGRFLQTPFRSFFSWVTATWYLGCTTAVMIGVSTWLLSDLVRLKRNLSLILLAGLLTTNYTMINSVAVYMPWVDSYGAALMFAVLAVWLTQRYKYGFLPGIICAVVVLGLYPPYIICVPAFVFLWLMFSVGKEEWKTRLIFVGKSVVMLLIAYGAYRLILNEVLKANNLSYAETDNSITAIGIPSFDNIYISRLLLIVNEFFFSLLSKTMQFSRYPKLTIVIVGFIFVISFIVYLRFTKATLPESLCAVILLSLTPLMFNIQFVICLNAVYHPLMVYSIYLAYVYFVIFYDSIDDKENKEESEQTTRRAVRLISRKNGIRAVSAAIAAAVIIVLFCDIRFANNVYTDKYMRERVTLSFMTRVIGEAEQAEGFEPKKTPVMIVGNPSDSLLIGWDEAFYPVMGEWYMPTSITYNVEHYLKYYMGYANPYASAAKQNELSENEIVEHMPAYPAAGFAQVIDGCLVIKVSE